MPPVLENQPPSQPLASLPRVRERGHLTLVDWENTASETSIPARTGPRRRPWVDRAFDYGFLLLLAVTALGAAASLVQH